MIWKVILIIASVVEIALTVLLFIRIVKSVKA
jgi:hypothetical protein